MIYKKYNLLITNEMIISTAIIITPHHIVNNYLYICCVALLPQCFYGYIINLY